MRKLKIKKRYCFILMILSFFCMDYLVYEQKKGLEDAIQFPNVVNRVFWIGILGTIIMMFFFVSAIIIYLQERKIKLRNDYLDEIIRKFFVPINGMIGISSQLEKQPDLSTYNQEQIHLIHDASNRLKRMMRDIEEYNRLLEGKISLNLSSIKLDELVAEVVSYIRNQNKNDQIVVENKLPSDLYVYIDAQKIQKIIGNILIVLINFTRKGTITISAGRRSTSIEVVIHDDGVGIEEHMKNIIFEPIEGANNISNGHYGGTGLSLAIARELILLHKGKIWINKELKQESEFHFTLPKADRTRFSMMRTFKDYNYLRDAGKNPVSYLHKDNPNAPNILLIKDASLHKNIMATYLFNEGYNIECPLTPMEILECRDLNQYYDLVIIDEVIGMSGFSLCRKIRDRYTLSQVPVLLIVANDRQTNLQTAFSAGANDCIDHLFLQEQILAKVQTLVIMKKSSDEALQSQISFLQAQIQPHFLYNALNVIMQLCLENPMSAHDVLADFSQYLRAKFDFRMMNRAITINQEINTIKSFLNVEKARFGDRLEYEIQLKGEGDRMIPSLIIQPLVENAAKHGIQGKQRGGKVMVVIEELPDQTKIWVKDNGVGMTKKEMEAILQEDNTEAGTGIRNINKRLALYNCKPLQLESVLDQGTTAILELSVAGLYSTGRIKH